MNKLLVNIVFFAVVALAIYLIRVSVVEQFTVNQMKRVEIMQDNQREVIQQRLEKEKAAQELRKLEEVVQVRVKAKDVRSCMAELGTDTLNNQVVECTKDHIVTMKRRDMALE